MTTQSPDAVRAFYAASLLGLRFLEKSLTDRALFGPAANALWDGFRGQLNCADRIDLLLRDAAVAWGPAFSPAKVFLLRALAGDEPFGPDWPSLDDDTARRLWREAERSEAGSPSQSMQQCLNVWRCEPRPAETIPNSVQPATRVLLAGPSALLAAVNLFASRTDLSFADQVIVAGFAPAERHLAGLAALFVRSRSATRLVAPSAKHAPPEVVRAQGFASLDLVLISSDASREASDFAHAAGSALR